VAAVEFGAKLKVLGARMVKYGSAGQIGSAGSSLRQSGRLEVRAGASSAFAHAKLARRPLGLAALEWLEAAASLCTDLAELTT